MSPIICIALSVIHGVGLQNISVYNGAIKCSQILSRWSSPAGGILSRWSSVLRILSLSVEQFKFLSLSVEQFKFLSLSVEPARIRVYLLGGGAYG